MRVDYARSLDTGIEVRDPVPPGQLIERLGGCTEPVRLLGQTTSIDTATAEALRTTADEPTGSLLTACGNRRASHCPACSRVYAADIFQLIRADLAGGKSVSDTVRTHPVTHSQLRDDRRAWRTEQARAHAGLPDLDPSTTLVIGHWAYHGSGYSPGAELLAAAVWHRRELAQQFTAEGSC
ncbi:replication initiator [Kitasatospora indigofera]|uniref:replication initiator n=1 Tax=Kitasatospora indigofera TaxID=67307 RepID=UPI00365D6469